MLRYSCVRCLFATTGKARIATATRSFQASSASPPPLAAAGASRTPTPRTITTFFRATRDSTSTRPKAPLPGSIRSSHASSLSSLLGGPADTFLRDGTPTSRFFRYYRAQLPFPLRMFGIFVLGFTLGLVIEIFACRTHLYESVMTRKDERRHEFDEFVVDFRQSVERWQREDMARR